MKRKRSSTLRTRTRRRMPAPSGLVAVFQAMQPYDFTRVYGHTSPQAFLDVHRAIARTSQDTNPHAFSKALATAANTEYPGAGFGPDGNQTAAECAAVMALAGFWAGVAACWQVMAAINGKDGAR